MALRMDALFGVAPRPSASRPSAAAAAAAAAAATTRSGTSATASCRRPVCACCPRGLAAPLATRSWLSTGLPPRSAALNRAVHPAQSSIARAGVDATSGPVQHAAGAAGWDTCSSTAQAAAAGHAPSKQQHHHQQHHQQQHQRVAAPFASLTRVLLIGAQPSNLARALTGRAGRFAGPVSLLMFLVGLLLGIVSAVRAALVRRVRDCTCCRGFGIQRCKLCNGEGTVAWMGKNNHQEMCPLCMTRRFVTCPDCGGYHHRKMFSHVRAGSASRGLVPDLLG